MRGVIPRMRITPFWALGAYLWKTRVWSTSGTPTYIYQMKDIHFFKKSLGADFRFPAVRNFYGCCKILYFFFHCKNMLNSKSWGPQKILSVFHEICFGSIVNVYVFAKNVWLSHPWMALIEISVQKN